MIEEYVNQLMDFSTFGISLIAIISGIYGLIAARVYNAKNKEK